MRLTGIVAELTVTGGSLEVRTDFELAVDGGARRRWHGGTHHEVARARARQVDLQLLLWVATRGAVYELAERGVVLDVPRGGPPVTLEAGDEDAAPWVGRIRTRDGRAWDEDLGEP